MEDDCEATGGQKLTVVDATYMVPGLIVVPRTYAASAELHLQMRRIKPLPKQLTEAVITFSTVGFGDFTPSTYLGRILGSVWMVMGTLAFANLATCQQEYV